MNKLRREHEIRIDELHRDIKSRDYSARESAEKVSYLELKNNEFKKELDSLEVELVKHR